MKRKKILPIVLMLPLVIAGVFLSSCLCPSAQASVVSQVAIQTSHHCCPNSHMNSQLEVGTVLTSNKSINESQGCCDDMISPSAPSIVGEQAISQFPFSQKDVSSLFAFANVSFPIIEEISTLNLKLSNLKLPQPQDIFLENEVLRI